MQGISIWDPSLFQLNKFVLLNSTLRDAQGLGGRLLDARPVPEAGGAKQLVLPAFFRPNRVLAILAFMAIIVAPWLIDQRISHF